MGKLTLALRQKLRTLGLKEKTVLKTADVHLS